MLKTIIGKFKKKKKKNFEAFQALRFFLFFFLSFKLKKLTQNPKVELERFWVGLSSKTK